MHNDSRILKSQQRNKQTDTPGNSHPYCIGQRLKYLFPQAGGGEQNKDQTLRQNQNQRIGIGQTEADAHGVDKNAFKPIPLAWARGRLDITPAKIVPTTAEMAVAI